MQSYRQFVYIVVFSFWKRTWRHTSVRCLTSGDYEAQNCGHGRPLVEFGSTGDDHAESNAATEEGEREVE